MTVPRSLLALALSLLVGCAIPGLTGPAGGPYPDVCDSFGFSPRQCAAIVTRAENESAIQAAEVAAIDILPPKRGSVNLGGAVIAEVRMQLVSGVAHTREIWCGVGSAADLACTSDPRIAIFGNIDHDVLCVGEPPQGCSVVPPTPRPASLARARPLRIDALDIPLDHIGHYEVRVGAAGLPDGLLSIRSATLADTQPTAFWTKEFVLIEVRPDDPTRPQAGTYYRGPFDGIEPVSVFIVFDVTETSPGAVLQIRNLVVE